MHAPWVIEASRSVEMVRWPESTSGLGSFFTCVSAVTAGSSTHSPLACSYTKSSQPTCMPQLLQHSKRVVACVLVKASSSGVATEYSTCASKLHSKCCFECHPMCSSGAGGGCGPRGAVTVGGGGAGSWSTYHPWCLSPASGLAGGGGAGTRA